MDMRIGLLTREGKPLYYTTANDLYFEGSLEQVEARLSRIDRNVKYVMRGVGIGYLVEIAFDTDYNCINGAKLWSHIYVGDAECYCVDNGVVGGRPFFKAFS